MSHTSLVVQAAEGVCGHGDQPRAVDSGGAAAVEAYRQLKRDRAEAYYFDELELNALGRELLFKLNRVHDATAVLTLNVEEHPDSYNVCDTMGYVLRKEGRTAEALDLYRSSWPRRRRSLADRCRSSVRGDRFAVRTLSPL